jgi:hypothetical protein
MSHLPYKPVTIRANGGTPHEDHMPHRIITSLLCGAALLAGDAAPAPLPPAAEAALDRLAKAEARIDADAARQRAAERQRTLKELERIQQAVTRSGDLDGALAVKARIDDLRAQEAAAADLLGDGAAPARSPAALAVGRWRVVKTNGVAGQIELRSDRTAQASAGPFVITGVWRIDQERIRITWGGDPARWESVAFDGPDRLAGDSHDAGTGGITMSRMPADPAPAR